MAHGCASDSRVVACAKILISVWLDWHACPVCTYAHLTGVPPCPEMVVNERHTTVLVLRCVQCFGDKPVSCANIQTKSSQMISRSVDGVLGL